MRRAPVRVQPRSQTHVALLVTLAATGPLAAQPPGAPCPAPPAVPAPAGPRPAALVAGLRPGERVRVSACGERVAGRVDGTAGDTLLVRPAAGPVLRLPAAAIDSLWDRRGWAAARGAKVGAVVGGVGLGGFALFLAHVLCDTATCNPGRNELTAVALVATVGAAGGGLVGAGVGALFPAWRRVHP